MVTCSSSYQNEKPDSPSEAELNVEKMLETTIRSETYAWVLRNTFINSIFCRFQRYSYCYMHVFPWWVAANSIEFLDSADMVSPFWDMSQTFHTSQLWSEVPGLHPANSMKIPIKPVNPMKIPMEIPVFDGFFDGKTNHWALPRSHRERPWGISRGCARSTRCPRREVQPGNVANSWQKPWIYGQSLEWSWRIMG